MEYRKGTYVITGVTGMMGGILAATLLDGSRLAGKLRTAPQCFRVIE